MPGSITITLSGLTNGPKQEGILGPDVRSMAQAACRAISAALSGAYPGTAKVGVAYSVSDTVYGSQTYTISGGSGSETATIGGTAVAVTWATSDANTASLLATAINADATAGKLVFATVASNVVTVTALVPGPAGNKITTTATGTGNTAGGATLTGGAGGADVFGCALTSL
jgi:phage tail sheath gpL-like